MSSDRRRRIGLLVLALPAIAFLFWFVAVWTSTLPDTFVVAVNVHGATLNPLTPADGLRPAPLSLSVLADAQQDAGSGSAAGAPTPRPTAPPATPTSTSRATATAKPAPIASPPLTPTPSIIPLPTPTLPTPTASATSGTGTITGQVTDSQTRLAIPGASVSLSPGGSSTSTDANGNFSLSVVSGTYTVTVSAPTYNSASQSVTVKAGQRVSMSFKLTSITAYGSLSGTVTDAATQAPILGATVTLSNGLARVTDTNGAFAFSILLNGTYTMTVSAVGYVSQSQQVTIKAGKTTSMQVALQ